MGKFVGIYYRPDGTIDSIVHADNDDFGPHDTDQTLTRVTLARAAYDALPQVKNVAGLAVHHDLNKACLPDLVMANPALAAKCQTSVDALDASLAAAQTKVAQDKAHQDAYNIWWDSLTPKQQQDVIDGLSPNGP